MWFIQPRQDYVAQMPWRHADEPAVMSWQIRTRDYHTFVANCMFFSLATIFFLVCYFFLFNMVSIKLSDKIFVRAAYSFGVFAFLLLILMSVTHQTAIIVYRFTERGGEVCSWKPQVDSFKPMMKWTAIVSGVVVLGLVLVEPAMLIAGVGPLGLGLMAALAGTSKSYASLVRDDRHLEIDWPNTEDIVVWRKRRLIGLRFTWHNEDGSHYSVYDKIYCRKEDFEACIAFFRERLPDTPYRESKLEVHSHFATLPESNFGEKA